MPIFLATNLASFSDSIEQHLLSPACPEPSEGSFQNFMKIPITSKPACFNRAAATELSTPPDMATTTRSFIESIMPLKIETFNVCNKKNRQ